MTVTTLTAPAATTDSDRVVAAASHMYDAEFALHAARQTGVDAWIAAAYNRLHDAIAEHTAALHGATYVPATAA